MQLMLILQIGLQENQLKNSEFKSWLHMYKHLNWTDLAIEINSFIFSYHFIVVRVPVDQGPILRTQWEYTWMGHQSIEWQVIEIFNSISVELYAYT